TQPSVNPLARDRREFGGTFVSPRRADSTKLALFNLQQSVASVDKDGVLTIDTSKDPRGHTYKWKPIAKDLFQQVGDQSKLFFIRDSGGHIVRAAGDFAGAQVERVAWYNRAKFVYCVLGGRLAISALVVLAA